MHGHIPDFCLVGEPTNPAALGEAIKIGRRGSLNAVADRARHRRATPPTRSAPTTPCIAWCAPWPP